MHGAPAREVRSRSYSAEAAAESPIITLRGGSCGGSSDPGDPSLWNVIYQRVSNDVAEWWFQDPEIWEVFGTESYVTIYGGPTTIALETGTLDPRVGEWPFWGRFTYCAAAEPDPYPECAVPEISSESRRHTLRIVER